MARPAKSVNVISKNLTDDEIKIRKQVEDKLKIGGAEDITPPKYLNREQKRIFQNIKELLKDTDMLSTVDVYLLELFSIAIYKIRFYEKKWNRDEELERLEMADLKEQRNVYFKCCQELCLSPQARAKMGTLALQKHEEAKDPVLKIFNG